MRKFSFEGVSIRAAGLFPSARHDWMQFHADEVPCPLAKCYGNLKWAEQGKRLRCDMCKREFGIRLLVRKTDKEKA